MSGLSRIINTKITQGIFTRTLLLVTCLLLLVPAAGTAAKVRLTVAHAWPEEVLVRQDAFDKQFMSMNPDIEIVRENYPWGEFNQKMKVRAAAGTLPDVMYLNNSWVAEWIDMGLCADLTPYVRSDQSFRLSDFVEPALFRDSKGVLRGLGYDASPRLLFFRTDLFDTAGLPYPDKSWTLQRDFAQAARKLTLLQDDRVLRYGLGIDFHYGAWPIEAQYYLPFGAKVAEWSNDRLNVMLDSTAAVEAAQWWLDLIFSDGIAMRGGDFAAGQIAMQFNGPWFRRSVRIDQTPYDVAHVPAGPVARSAPVGGSLYIITTTSKQADVAWRYLSAYLGTENQRFMWGNVGDGIPSRRSAWDSFLQSGAQGRFAPSAHRFLEAMGDYAVMPPLYVGIEKVYQAYNDEMGAKAGKQPAANILESIVSRARGYLGR